MKYIVFFLTEVQLFLVLMRKCVLVPTVLVMAVSHSSANTLYHMILSII